MQVNYTVFIARVIDRYEGPYGWDKGDPGGPTKDGITCFDLAEHRGQKMTSMTTWAPIVKAMPLAEAEDIYAHKYAKALYFDTLRSGPDCAILDYGINSGIGRPLRVARALLNFTDPSNPNLIDAINRAHQADPKWFIDALGQERLHFMHQIRGGKAWEQFGHGWSTRVADVDSYSDYLATGAPLPTPPLPPDVHHPKVTHGDPNATASTAGKTAAGGAAAGGAAAAAGPPHWIVPVVVGVVIVAGIGYAVYQSRKHAAANMAVVIPPSVPQMPPAVLHAVSVSAGGTNVA
jgi:lysozyme family protein